MKRILFIVAILCFAIAGFAQTENAKMMEMLKQMQNTNGKITLAIEGKTYTEKASFFKSPKGKFVLSTAMAGSNNTLAIVLPKKESGSYPFSTDKKEQTVLMTQNGAYEVKSGTIKLTNSAGKISGTFTGETQKFEGKNGNKKPQGKLIPFSGSFSGLTY